MRSVFKRVDNQLLIFLGNISKGVWFSGPHRQTPEGNLRSPRDNSATATAAGRGTSGPATYQGTGEGVENDVNRRKKPVKPVLPGEQALVPTVFQRPERQTLAEYVTAWRFWKIDRDDTGLCLRSLVVDVKWPKGQLLKATCRFRETNRDQNCGQAGDHSAPLYRGECGVYGYRTAAEAIKTTLCEGYMRGRVIGTVALAGVGIHHEMGYRARFAYPLKLVAAGCAVDGEVISLSDAYLAARGDNLKDKETDATFAVFCSKHIEVGSASFDWVSMLAAQYSISVGGLHEFI